MLLLLITTDSIFAQSKGVTKEFDKLRINRKDYEKLYEEGCFVTNSVST
jgi:hypothetical protein